MATTHIVISDNSCHNPQTCGPKKYLLAHHSWTLSLGLTYLPLRVSLIYPWSYLQTWNISFEVLRTHVENTHDRLITSGKRPLKPLKPLVYTLHVYHLVHLVHLVDGPPSGSFECAIRSSRVSCSSGQILDDCRRKKSFHENIKLRLLAPFSCNRVFLSFGVFIDLFDEQISSNVCSW